MAIKFIQDYSVGTPAEQFKVGQVEKDRGPASELHFVRRGVAGYLAADGTLTNVDGVEIEDPTKPRKPARTPAKTAAARSRGAVKKPVKGPLANRRPAPAAVATNPAAGDPLKASAAPPKGAVLTSTDVKKA